MSTKRGRSWSVRGLGFGAVGIAAAALVGSVGPPVSAVPGPGALAPRDVLEIQITGARAVPHDAAAALVTVTFTQTAADGWAVVFPCTDDLPTTSNVNYQGGADAANAVLATLSPDGTICVATSAATDLVVDVSG